MRRNNQGGINFNLQIDPETTMMFKKYLPDRLQKARTNAVEAMGMVWADTTKEITRAEDHIDTGLYVNSIGYSSGSPSKPLYELDNDGDGVVLEIGADVAYAEALEKRYSLMARGLDSSLGRMRNVAKTQIKKTLRL